MKDFIVSNFDKIIAVFCILEFEFVLIYRRRYLKDSSRTNLMFMLLTILLFADSFIFTIVSFQKAGSSTDIMLRLIVHTIFVPVLIIYYAYRRKAEH